MNKNASGCLDNFECRFALMIVTYQVTLLCSRCTAALQVEEEIQTLAQVLAAKEKHVAEIKRKLGIGSLQEFRQNIAKGWQDVTETPA